MLDLGSRRVENGLKKKKENHIFTSVLFRIEEEGEGEEGLEKS